MTTIKPTTVLLVDRTDDWGPSLRERLMKAGMHVHVVNTRETALRFASVKIIDVAVIAYAMDGWTDELCADLRRMGVPYVFTADMSVSPPTPRWIPSSLQDQAAIAH
jgi:DNA-binding response OmpR family regulator